MNYMEVGSCQRRNLDTHTQPIMQDEDEGDDSVSPEAPKTARKPPDAGERGT